MAGRAGIRYAGLLRLARSDESEGVRRHVAILDRLLDRWHVAGDALASRTVRSVMRVLTDCPLESSRIRAIVAIEAECIAVFQKV